MSTENENHPVAVDHVKKSWTNKLQQHPYRWQLVVGAAIGLAIHAAVLIDTVGGVGWAGLPKSNGFEWVVGLSVVAAVVVAVLIAATEKSYRKTTALALFAGALTGVLLRYLFSGSENGVYSAMLGAFLYGAPALSAAISVHFLSHERRQKCLTCIGVGLLSATLLVLGSMLVMLEGMICAIVIFPFFALVGAATGLVMWAIYRLIGYARSKRVLYSIAPLPLVLGALEPYLLPPPHIQGEAVQTVIIAASPDVVWRNITHIEAIGTEGFAQRYVHRIGAPAPLAASTSQGPNGQWVHHMQWQKGVHFYGDVYDWQPQRKMAWHYRFVADSFPPDALDEHVTLGSSFFELQDSAYTIEAVPGGSKLTLRVRWRISTQFNFYARWIADEVVNDTMVQLLDIHRARSEWTAPEKGKAS